jgi:hypothetical protein
MIGISKAWGCEPVSARVFYDIKKAPRRKMKMKMKQRGKKSWLANDAVKLIVLGMKVTLTASIETNLNVVSPTRQTVDE